MYNVVVLYNGIVLKCVNIMNLKMIKYFIYCDNYGYYNMIIFKFKCVVIMKVNCFD